MKNDILQSSLDDLKVLATSVGKTLTPQVANNLFLRKKAYQSDWVEQDARRKATLIAGATVMAIGTPTEEDIKSRL